MDKEFEYNNDLVTYTVNIYEMNDDCYYFTIMQDELEVHNSSYKCVRSEGLAQLLSIYELLDYLKEAQYLSLSHFNILVN